MSKLVRLLAVLSQGCPPHGSTAQRADGGWYCTDCGARVW